MSESYWMFTNDTAWILEDGSIQGMIWEKIEIDKTEVIKDYWHSVSYVRPELEFDAPFTESTICKPVEVDYEKLERYINPTSETIEGCLGSGRLFYKDTGELVSSFDGFEWRCPNCMSTDFAHVLCDGTCYDEPWNCGEYNHCASCGLVFLSIDAIELKEITHNENH